jgi:[protein-PII] uridylyltransferase
MIMSTVPASVSGRELYAAESSRLRQMFPSQYDGRRLARARSDLVDRVVHCLLEQHWPGLSGRTDGMAVLAVGGYGRRELYPHSDLDLLFLFSSQRWRDANQDAVAAAVRALWDLGLRVGSSSRTLEECYEVRRDNLEFTTSLLDARLLSGSVPLWVHLRDEAVPHVFARDQRDFVDDLISLTRRRHEKYGRTIFHLEPNVKEAPGGLRDYQVAGWLTLINELAEHGRWAPPQAAWPAALRAASEEAYARLSTIRCFLHYRRNRDDNLLSYELQEEAAAMGLATGLPTPAGEWMRGYFRCARVIQQLAAHVTEEAARSRSSIYGFFQQWKSRLANADFSVVRGRIFPRSAAVPPPDARMVLDLFEMVARHALELSHQAERWVAGSVPLLKPSDPQLWEHFRRILLLPHAAAALRAMHRLGVLVALFPEFRAVDALVVRDFYHRYTVDEHSFMAIQHLQGLRASPGASQVSEDWEARFGELAGELERPELLCFALLFHDVGKGLTEEGHVQASVEAAGAICSRLEMAAEDRETVSFLIAHHLDMSATLQRRDIFDPETIRGVAETVVVPERLKMLCLMTYADIKAVNPEALTSWKAEMLWRLYAAVANHLARSVDEERVHYTEALAPGLAAILPALPQSIRPDELEAFLEGFPRRYLATHTPAEIAQHFLMARELARSHVQVRVQPRGHFYELTVMAEDRPFLFASITGTLAAWGMSILKADAFANRAGVVLDTFRFRDLFRTLELNPPEVPRFERSVVDVLTGVVRLETLMSGRMQKQPLPAPKVVTPTQLRFDNASSSHSTLLELTTQDFPGLLYRLSSCLSKWGCNIEVALVDTEGQKAIDVFYLTYNGVKLTPDQQESLKQAILESLASPQPSPAAA